MSSDLCVGTLAAALIGVSTGPTTMSNAPARTGPRLSFIDRPAVRFLWTKIVVEGALLAVVYLALWQLFDPTSIERVIAPIVGAVVMFAIWSIVRIRQAKLEVQASVAPLLDAGRTVPDTQKLEMRTLQEQKMASLGGLTASFARELEDPLASLSAELEVLDMGGSAEHMKESVVALRQEVGRMTRTVREMIDFSRRRREDVASATIASAIADAVRLSSGDPRFQHVKHVLDLGVDLPAAAINEDHLVLVLGKLIENAVSAMPDAGTLTIAARRRGGKIVILVEDTSDGMTAESLAYAKNTLAFCYDCVREAGGELELTSRVGEGTTAQLELPVRAS